MPKLLRTRAALDEEEHHLQKLARSDHAPVDWVFHEWMVMESWTGPAHTNHRSGLVLSFTNGAGATEGF